MIESELANAGMAGAFILYLIYDRKVLIQQLIDAVKTNTEATNRLANRIKK